MARIGGVAAKFFRLAFSNAEWEDLKESQTAIDGKLRALQLKRQRQILETLCESAIDLTVWGNQREMGMQSELMQGNMTFVSVLLDRVGMNARGTVVTFFCCCC